MPPCFSPRSLGLSQLRFLLLELASCKSLHGVPPKDEEIGLEDPSLRRQRRLFVVVPIGLWIWMGPCTLNSQETHFSGCKGGCACSQASVQGQKAPRILYAWREMYATPAFLGALTCVLVTRLGTLDARHRKGKLSQGAIRHATIGSPSKWLVSCCFPCKGSRQGVPRLLRHTHTLQRADGETRHRKLRAGVSTGYLKTPLTWQKLSLT